MGRAAGKDFVRKLKEDKISCTKEIVNGKVVIKGMVDIVAHSMGFAYSLGMIEVLQEAGINIGNYYVVAPENACSGSVPNEVRTFQYGSNEVEDPIELQDVVVPQCAIKGFVTRAYIPLGERKKEQLGFTQSHSIDNYDWIFTTIKKGKRAMLYRGIKIVKICVLLIFCSCKRELIKEEELLIDQKEVESSSKTRIRNYDFSKKIVGEKNITKL
jgi:hypothetical protein